MEFWVNLIVTAKEQSDKAADNLKGNCTYIDNNVWIYEGERWCLEDDGVLFNVISEGAVPCLGDLSQKELVELCSDIFDVDIYGVEYKSGKCPKVESK